MFVSALAALFICEVESHGYISNPQARATSGWWDNVPEPPHPYLTEPQSAGATGKGDPIPVCGRDDSGAIERRLDDKIGVITRGQSFEFKAFITAHHMGHMTVRICPYIDQNFTVSRLSECVTVEGADGSPFWWLSPGTGEKTWSGMIPTNLPTTTVDQAYTVQWRWNTANSCCPHKGAYQHKTLPETWCSGECKEGWISDCSATDPCATDLYDGTGSCSETICCSEVFTNCADVKLAGSNPAWPPIRPAPTAATPEPEPEPETTPAPTGAPNPESEAESSTPAPTPAPTAAPTPAPTGGDLPCVRNTDCGTNDWCNDSGYDKWCADQDAYDGSCPSPECTRHPQTALAQISPHVTKFSGKIQQDVGRIRQTVAANGDIADISDDA